MENGKLKNQIKINSTDDVLFVTKKWRKRPEENFLVITLNPKHIVKKVHHVTKGLLNKTVIHPRECFYPAIRDYAFSVVLVHNHPDDDERPSDNDDKITTQLCAAGYVLGIEVIDHVIITPNGKGYSYAANGKLKNYFTDKQINNFIKSKPSGGKQ